MPGVKWQDFRVGIRLLRKDPVYALVAILGLGVALAVCLLLLGYARYSWQYDSHVLNVDEVYVVKQRSNLELGAPLYGQVPMLLVGAARKAPGVETATGYLNWFPLTVQVNGPLQKLQSLTVLPGFAELLGLHAIQGDLTEALSRPDAFAMTESTARRVFGTTDVIGRTVILRLSAVDENRVSARVAAIVRDPPSNTTIPYETLNGPHLGLIPPFMTTEALTGEQGWLGYVLVRVRAGASIAAVTESLQRAIDSAPAIQRAPPEAKARLAGRKIMDVSLSPLREAYFDREVKMAFPPMPIQRGNAEVVAGLVVIGALILALAVINYVNLATLRVIRRQREIAMRKVLGVRKGRLVSQFMAESLLVSLAATAIGLVLAWLVLPVFGELMNRDLSGVLDPGSIGAALGLGSMVGAISAIHPAWTALNVRPALMLAGRPDTESLRSKRLRQVLSIAQVSAAIALASFALAVAWQSRFAMNASPGFDPSPLLVFMLPVGATSDIEKARGLIAELTQDRAVAGVAVTRDPVGVTVGSMSAELTTEGGTPQTVDLKSVSPGFFEQYGVAPVAGRLFDPKIEREGSSESIVMNAMAARRLGFASPELAVGQSLQFKSAGSRRPTTTRRIVGIAPDIRFYSLREPPQAMVYEVLNEGEAITVRARDSAADAERVVREAWPRYFPNSVIELSSVKDVYTSSYADDARLAKLLALATVIAMIIAAFGAYVLAADAVQRRTAEIALRKLFGARRSDIGKLVARELGIILAASAVIAVPVAALAIARYLSAYVERTPFAYWALALALGVALITVTAAAGKQAWVAMKLRPSVALRG